MSRPLVFLLLALAVDARAQPAPPADRPARSLGSHWRAAVSVGLATTLVARSVSLERSALGPASVGVRGTRYGPETFLDDGPAPQGGGAEGFVSVGAHGRRLDVRLAAGAGLAVIERTRFDGAEPFGGRRVTTVRPYTVVGVGADLYLVRWVGVGADLRFVPSDVGAGLSEVGVGLRVRLGG